MYEILGSQFFIISLLALYIFDILRCTLCKVWWVTTKQELSMQAYFGHLLLADTVNYYIWWQILYWSCLCWKNNNHLKWNGLFWKYFGMSNILPKSHFFSFIIKLFLNSKCVTKLGPHRLKITWKILEKIIFPFISRNMSGK